MVRAGRAWKTGRDWPAILVAVITTVSEELALLSRFIVSGFCTFVPFVFTLASPVNNPLRDLSTSPRSRVARWYTYPIAHKGTRPYPHNVETVHIHDGDPVA